MSEAVSSPIPVLFVEDDADVQKAARLLLPRHGFTLHAARTPDEAWSVLAGHAVRLVLLDLNFSPGATSGAEGLALLDALLAHDPGLAVVVVTAHSGIRIAVAAMRAGATDFVMKPWNNERLASTLHAAAGRAARRRETGITGVPSPGLEDGPLLGECPALVSARALIGRLAPTAAAVLLTGPAGSGKSMAARMLHRLSPRAGRTLHVLHPPALWTEGEPAFLAALDALDPGDTVLLDGLDGLALPAQGRLLALLDRLAGLRVLSASRADVASLRAAGMRDELLTRLSLVEIALPPLTSRGDDAALLARHFLGLFGQASGRAGLALSEPALEAVVRSAWPDNIRGLRQAVERAVLLADPARTMLEPFDLLDGRVTAAPAQAQAPTLRDTERNVVEAALRRHGFNVSRAAQELGLTRTALYRRMARYGL